MKIKHLVLLLTVTAMILSGCATSRYYHLGSREFDDFDYGFATKKVQVRNIQVACIDEGRSDRVLVLIHGLGSSAKGWGRNIPELAKHYRVIAVDLPGYGKSDKGFYPYTLPFYAQVLTELLSELKVQKAVFVGHSMGGQIAMVTSLLYPERVDKLARIRYETLIFFGQNDNLIPNSALHGGSTESIAQIGAGQIPKNKLIMVPECGHFVQFEKPEVVNPAIVEFVGSK